MIQKIAFSAALMLTASLSAQTIIYVDADATGNNNGTSWADAYTDPYMALSQNTASDAELWIAEGFYSTSSPVLSFTIDDDEDIYGGFNGTETARDQRDFRNNVTILSGDSGWNDAGTEPGSTANWSDNSDHVIEITSLNSVVIDGVTIEHGYGQNSSGGGVNCASTGLNSLTIQNCTIRKNGALDRAGVLYYTYSPNSTFNFFNNIVEENVNLGNYAFTIEYRYSSGNAGISGVAHIVNNLFRANTCALPSAGAICGRFTNLLPGTMDVNLVNNTIIDNPHGSSFPAAFAYEFGSANAAINLFINNNILYNNNGVTRIMDLSNGDASQVYYSTSYENVQDFPDLEGLTNTHVVSSSPFMDYANGNYTPITQYQTTGRYQAYSTLYPTYGLGGNDRLTSTGAIGIGAYQVDASIANIDELNDEELLVYPNPASDQFTISWDEFSSGKFTLLNTIGQAVLTSKIDGKEITCDASNLPAGIYVALVELENSVHTIHITLH